MLNIERHSNAEPFCDAIMSRRARFAEAGIYAGRRQGGDTARSDEAERTPAELNIASHICEAMHLQLRNLDAKRPATRGVR
jgi:hypothetical protein